MLENPTTFHETRHGWELNGVVWAPNEEKLRSMVVVALALGRLKIDGWRREGRVITVTTRRARPCSKRRR